MIASFNLLTSFRQWPPRLQAFSIHFAISFVIFVVLLTLMVRFWFPQYLFNSDGGWEALRLLIGVDLVLGPVLTLVVYKQGKKHLKVDLALIGLLQISCLVIGMGIVYKERPLGVVFSDNRFLSISQGTFDFAGTDSRALEDYPNTYPRYIYIPFPEDPEERKALRRRQTGEGPLHGRPDHFAKYADHAHKVAKEGGVSVAEIKTKYPDLTPSIDKWLEKTGYTEETIVWVPYHGRYKSTYLILDPKTGVVLGQIPNRLNPKNV